MVRLLEAPSLELFQSNHLLSQTLSLGMLLVIDLLSLGGNQEYRSGGAFDAGNAPGIDDDDIPF